MTLAPLKHTHRKHDTSSALSHHAFRRREVLLWSTRLTLMVHHSLEDNARWFLLADPVLTPSDVNVIAVTGDDRITLSCTPKGVNPSLSAVRWRANGTVLAVEEGASRIILSDELVSTLIFTLVEPAISGVYTCELVEYPSVSANISVVVELGQSAYEP